MRGMPSIKTEEREKQMRIAISTDTNSGLTKESGEKLGIYILPMPFSISRKDYLESVDFSTEEFFQRMRAGEDIQTSQPSPGQLTELWDEILKQNDQLIYIPMSSGLSGTFETAKMLSQEEEYAGRVFVVNNQRISGTQMRSALDAKILAQKGLGAERIQQILEETALDATIYLTVDTLKYLKKGGRITPAAAALGTLLRIKPVLTIQGAKLDAWAKVRTMKQAKAMMLSAVKEDLSRRFSDEDGSKTDIYVIHADCIEAAKEFRREIAAELPGAEEIQICDLSLSINTHVGPGTLAIAAAKKLNFDRYE